MFEMIQSSFVTLNGNDFFMSGINRNLDEWILQSKRNGTEGGKLPGSTFDGLD